MGVGRDGNHLLFRSMKSKGPDPRLQGGDGHFQKTDEGEALTVTVVWMASPRHWQLTRVVQAQRRPHLKTKADGKEKELDKRTIRSTGWVLKSCLGPVLR